jgi:hypothetical protein
MLGNRWARNFTVADDDVDYLMNILLEQEMPMTTRQLSRLLIEQRLEAEQIALEEQYRNTKIYNPINQYAVGDRLIFTTLELAVGTVEETRIGDNPDHGEFMVIAIKFDENELNLPDKYREFAANLKTEHPLNPIEEENPLINQTDLDPDELLDVENNYIMRVLHEALRDNPSLKRVAGFWFPEELVLECDIGVLHLSEAVLDMAGGGPLSTKEILEQIGDIGDAPIQLQIFSLNLALNEDERFDEVGPAGQVMWYLNRMAPDAVREIPALLKYIPIEYDDDLLDDAMYELETELDDEFTDIDFEGSLPRATTALIYPHRRAGTLPLNAKNIAIFPAARAPRIYVELIDAEDGQSFNGWVIHGHHYVYGFLEYYTKHHLPVGVYLTVEPGDKAGQIRVSHQGYKPRTEWIRILTPLNNRIHFENKKRQIGAEYDDLIIIGVDDLAAVDKLAKTYANKSLATIIRDAILALGELTPQKTVHAVTLYSAVNVIRRCAPGPIFATLSANPDFEDVGDHYWKLSENE